MPRYIYNKCFLVLIIVICAFTNIKAQKLELGILVGGSYYYGDIVNEIEPSTIGGAGGVFLRYHINEKLAIKGFGGYCKIGGADSNSASSTFQQHRNLAFWADVYEGSVQLEYSLIKDITRGRRLRNRFIPYVFVGVGAFYYNNYANYPLTNAPVALYQLGTSGTRYDNYAICVPLGIGAKYKITSHIYLGLEFGVRYTSTSWLDDVGGVTSYYVPQSQLPYETARVMADRSASQNLLYSGKQRGKITINDLYFISGLTLSYRFGSGAGGAGSGGYKGRAIRCPRFY